MTRLLAEAFDKAVRLPDELQDVFARDLLDWIVDNAGFDAAQGGNGPAT